jgi:hypothetical protein
MKITNSEGVALLMVIGPIIFIVGLFTLSIKPILVGIGMFIIGYIRDQQIKKGY